MLPKITVTIDGPSCQGIGKSTVSHIIEQALRKFGYEVAYVAVPGADNPHPLTPDTVKKFSKLQENAAGRSRDLSHPENSEPRATINLIERV